MMRQPRSFSIDPDNNSSDRKPSTKAKVFDQSDIIVEDDPFDAIDREIAPPVILTRKSRWLTLFFSTLSALFSMALALWLERLVRDFFALSPWLGWIALALAGLALCALVVLVGREIFSLLWEKKIERLRLAASDVIAVNNTQKAQILVKELASLYETADNQASQNLIRNLQTDILDADDRLAIGEREFLVPLDLRAKQLVAQAAKRVSVVTAVSPRAFIDVAFVLYTITRLLRQIASLYGGRPGFFGLIRLFRLAFTHLALTTGIAVGDSIAHDVLGAGIAARLSSRLGEGVLNGTLTARFGLAAIAVCRPLPFIKAPAPRFSDVAGELFSKELDKEKQ